MAVVPVCTGVVTEAGGVASCSTPWQLLQYEQVVPFDPAQLSAADCAGAFAAGFGMLFAVWAMCKSVEVILRMIK